MKNQKDYICTKLGNAPITESNMDNRQLFFQGKGFASRLILFFGITLVSLSVFSLAGIFLLRPLFGISPFAIAAITSNPDEPGVKNILLFLQFTQAIGLFLIPTILFSWLEKGDLFEYLGFRLGSPMIIFSMTVMLVLAIQPLINFTGELNSRMILPGFLKGIEDWMKESEATAARLTESFLKFQSVPDLFFVFLIMAVIPAFGEEMLFRGVLQRLLGEWMKNKHVAIFITAILFSALHMQFYGFVPRFILGVMLGYLYHWTGTLWMPVTAHFINNGSAVLLAYLMDKGIVDFEADKVGTSKNEWYWVCLSVMVCTAIAIFIYKRTKIEKSIKS